MGNLIPQRRSAAQGVIQVELFDLLRRSHYRWSNSSEPDFGFPENKTQTVSSSGTSPTMTLRRSKHSWTLLTGPRGLILLAHVLIERSSLSGSSVSLGDICIPIITPPLFQSASSLPLRKSNSCIRRSVASMTRGDISSVDPRRASLEGLSYKYTAHLNFHSYLTHRLQATRTCNFKLAFDLQLPEPSYFKVRCLPTLARILSRGLALNRDLGLLGLLSLLGLVRHEGPCVDEHADPSALTKFQDRLAKNPWKAVVSKVRTPVDKIREKYHIPSDYIIIPATFDRMHRPPEGFCAFSIKHLDAGLRFPFAPPVAAILNKLRLCPMQLSPNSVTHIILFVVLMQFLDLERSFDNFWSLYSFTTSKRSGSRGAWLDRYIFIRPPRGVWPFKNEWTKYKPVPETSRGGLEGDQIRSLTFYKYVPKKLLTEKVLQLSGLSPVSLHIEESLDSIIMSTRTAMRRIAAQNKAKKGGEVAGPSDPKGKGGEIAGCSDLPSSSPAPVPSKALAIAPPAGQQPILVDSEETPSAHGYLGYNSSELELNLDEASGDHGVDQGRQDPPPEERSKKRKRSPKKGHGPKSKLGPGDKGKGKEPAETSHPPPPKSHSPSVLSRMAKEATDKTSVDEDRDKFFRVAQLATCWEESRAALRGNVPPPEWQDMSSLSLYGEAGDETFAIYNSFVSVRDQGALVTNSSIRLEEFVAHSMVQAMTFLRSLSLKCTHYRMSYIQTDQKVQHLRTQLAEQDETERKQEDNLLALGDEVLKLRAELDAAKKERKILRSKQEVALAEAKREAFDAGREASLVEGHKRGVEEGQAGRIPIKEYQRALAGSRMSAVHDFLKTDTFTTTLEIKSADSFSKGYETCRSQIEKLGGFHDSFDPSKLDISLDGDL
ncbi:UNVERIFIED_CONTAM: hypothetical protein Sindi_1688100 [Sesamum indicum]